MNAFAYMSRKTLTIYDDTKTRFDELNDASSQDAFLNTLLDAYEEDTESPTGAVTSEDVERLSKRLEAVEEQLSNVPRDTADYLR